MRIGLVSDSHGEAQMLRRGVELLCARGAEVIVHCGDIGSLECLDVLAEAPVPSHAVAGNADLRVDPGAERLAARASGKLDFHVASVELDLGDGVRLAATHGHDRDLLDELIAGGRFAYVCHGHTHTPRNERVGSVRVVNPGCLHRRTPTVALLDTAADAVEHIGVD